MKWITTADLLPEIGTLVLCYASLNDEYLIVFYDGLSLNFDFWQHLPKKP